MSNVEAYLKLLQEQIVLRRGPDSDDSDEEDHRLADEMDTYWRRMSQAEHDEANAQAEIALRREEERVDPDKVLELLRELIEKVQPKATGDAKLAKRVSAMMGAGQRIQLGMEQVELAADLSLIAQQFQDLDEWITKGGFLPKAWQPLDRKEGPKPYAVRLIFQIEHKDGPVVELATAEECAKKCAELHEKGLESGWMPRVDRAPLEEMVWGLQSQQYWQAPNGYLYQAEYQDRPSPRSFELTEEQKKQRYWGDVAWVATAVVSGVLMERLRPCGSMGPDALLALWIDVETDRLPQHVSCRVFREDVMSLLVKRGFDLEAFETWSQTVKDLACGPKNLTM